uniref:Uncharacterized protein n=1 Tax=Aegilops tauschii subsp. strangulata TaxID=200361 RepID=A0A453PBR6_AEGTS
MARSLSKAPPTQEGTTDAVAPRGALHGSKWSAAGRTPTCWSSPTPRSTTTHGRRSAMCSPAPLGPTTRRTAATQMQLRPRTARTPRATSTSQSSRQNQRINPPPPRPPRARPPRRPQVRRIGGDTTATVGYYSDHLLQQMFSQSYRPMMPEEAGGYHHQDDFFADLTELDSDPVSLIFSTEYMEARPGKEKAAAKDDVDSLFMMDWAPA